MDEHKKDIITEVNQKNTKSIEQTLKAMEERFQHQEQNIINLNNTISNMYERINSLENTVRIYQIRFIGNGPSVGE